MITRPPAWRLAMLAALAALAGCSRASLYAVTGGGGHPGAGSDGGAAGARASSGCSSAGSAGDSSRTVQVDAMARTYVLHVPQAHDGGSPSPLVVDFHGIGLSGAAERTMSPYPDELDPAGVVMAFPDGIKGPAGTAWNVGPCCVAGVDDVAFARAVVADVGQTACIDLDRVYAVGVLTGGGMAHYVGCHAADLFAGVAPAAFDLLAENLDDCLPQRAITEISFRGTDDPRVPYAGGASSLIPSMPITFLGAVDTFDAWARIDGCSGAASSPDANGCARHASCRDGVEVVLCTKQGGGDDPGDPTLAWPVLMRHRL
jgi:polyhydroxybutyrate depolymerase